MRNLALALAAVGAIALSVPAPASAAPLTGLKIAPQVDAAGPEEVRRRCYHRRHSTGWRCYGHHSRWQSRHNWRHRHYHRYHHGPGIYFRL